MGRAVSTETRITRLVVAPEGATTFDERATTVEIEDEAAGEFVTVTQCYSDTDSVINIDPAEWPALREAIDRMIAECRA